MYNVMLVDDDYPVIELLSEAIHWEALGLRLIGAHDNGLHAWEQAQREMPDIVITDIGMPKMDGLELIGLLKQRKANVRVAILSCHSEFQFAQQAMRMNVQEYLLKDALNPADLERLLAQFKDSLDLENRLSGQQSRLKHIVDETKELRKEQWLKNFIHQPLLSPGEWRKEANAYGLFEEGTACIAAIGFIEGYRQAKQRFLSVQTLRFAVGNVLEEVLSGLELHSVHAGYGAKESILLFAYRPDLKVSMYEQITTGLRTVQAALKRALKLQMSFVLGESCLHPAELKQSLRLLLESDAQRFYLEPGAIVRKGPGPAADLKQDLFAHYDRANTELRELLIGKKSGDVQSAVEGWITVMRQGGYAPETVKDWMLKLILDLKLKLQSLQFTRSSFSADTLHKEIVDIDSLSELKQWLVDHLQAVVALAGKGAGGGLRAEVMEACKYVSLHLDKRIGLEEVAEHLFLNPSYFSRLFKKETGENFIEYITRMKMERAKELLDQTAHPVGKICEMLGYDNQSYFIKIFKTHAGVTPLEYRG